MRTIPATVHPMLIHEYTAWLTKCKKSPDRLRAHDACQYDRVLKNLADQAFEEFSGPFHNGRLARGIGRRQFALAALAGGRLGLRHRRPIFLS